MHVLEELHVRDLALIEEAWLEFGPGMTVLTGETGAGKTVVLGALKLLLGERADTSAVRAGASETLVEGRFVVDGQEMVAKRRVRADGRSRCTLDGEIATVGSLSQSVGPLVDLHGQHEHQALLHPSTHGGYLDRWAGESVSGYLDRYRTARSEMLDAVRQRDEIAAASAEAAQNADYLAFVAEEIERVGPIPGEDDALEARLPALQHAEKLSEAVDEAVRALRADGGAGDALARAQALLAKVGGIDPELDSLTARLAEAVAVVDDVGADARAYRDSIEHDPKALEAVMSRLSALSGLKRKYGPALDDVISRAEQARVALASIDDDGQVLRAAQERVDRARRGLREAGEQLDGARRQAAPHFVAALKESARGLSMGDASFDVAFSDRDFDRWTDSGPSSVEFLYAPAAGQPPRPLARIASGGEISRVMLALKDVLGSADTVSTLVFDEVDAGIGGATASAVGARLARLAGTHQVIVVTHLAQVAVYADHHFLVEKAAGVSGAETQVRAVAGEDRVSEIARMLSGQDSEASRAHAAELLEGASVPS